MRDGKEKMRNSAVADPESKTNLAIVSLYFILAYIILAVSCALSGTTIWFSNQDILSNDSPVINLSGVYLCVATAVLLGMGVLFIWVSRYRQMQYPFFPLAVLMFIGVLSLYSTIGSLSCIIIWLFAFWNMRNRKQLQYAQSFFSVIASALWLIYSIYAVLFSIILLATVSGLETPINSSNLYVFVLASIAYIIASITMFLAYKKHSLKLSKLSGAFFLLGILLSAVFYKDAIFIIAHLLLPEGLLSVYVLAQKDFIPQQNGD